MIHGHSDVAKLSYDTLSVSVTAESVLGKSKKSRKKTDGNRTTWSRQEPSANLLKKRIGSHILRKRGGEAPPNAMKGCPTRE